MSQSQVQPWSKELSQALAWWKSTLSASKSKVAPEAALIFESTLSDLLNERLSGHWFPENPIRGQAHRSLSLHRHARPDPVLLKAATAAKIRNLFDVFDESVTDVTMFIDPCEVAVQTAYTYCKTPQDAVVWSSPNKLNKRKPNMEPSAPLRIKAKPVDSHSSSNSNSSAENSPRLSPIRRPSFEEASTLKASSREYSPSNSPASSPQRRASPPPFSSVAPLPYYVPMPQYYQQTYANSGFDSKLTEFVRS